MNANWREIKREFLQRRENALVARDHRRETAYKKIPELETLDHQITALGISFSRNAIKRELKPENAMQFEKELNGLVEKKKQLLLENGFSDHYLDVVYSCPHCNDTGFALDETGKPGVTPCHCYRQLLVERFYDHSNLNSDGSTGFEFFNETFYPDTTEDHSESPRTRALLIREKCLEFVNRFEQNDCPNICFTGPTGVGKTFFSKCIALEILKKGHTVLYLPAPAMFDIIYRSKYNFGDMEKDTNNYQYILDAELLIIDDLGTESPSAAKYTELLTLLNYRNAKNIRVSCKTILSTNIEPQDLHKTYSERVESRILGEFDILTLIGDDIRLVKRLQNIPDC